MGALLDSGQLLDHAHKKLPLTVRAGRLRQLGRKFEILTSLLKDGPDYVQHAVVQRREEMVEDVVSVHGQLCQ